MTVTNERRRLTRDDVEAAFANALGEAESKARSIMPQAVVVAGVGRRDPRFPAASGRRHRAAANSSSQAPEPCFAAAPGRRELHVRDRLLVGANDARNLRVEVEILRRGLSRGSPLQHRLDEGAGVERSPAH